MVEHTPIVPVHNFWGLGPSSCKLLYCSPICYIESFHPISWLWQQKYWNRTKVSSRRLESQRLTPLRWFLDIGMPIDSCNFTVLKNPWKMSHFECIFECSELDLIYEEMFPQRNRNFEVFHPKKIGVFSQNRKINHKRHLTISLKCC